MTNEVFDVVVVGGGVVGCAVARELSAYQLSVALIEVKGDVGDGTSKANTAILHTGFDASPGTLESRLVPRGYELLTRYAASTGIPVEGTGAVLVAWSDDELDALPRLRDKAAKNGYQQCELITADAVYARVPTLGAGALGGMTVPDESIICPWTTTLALATDAMTRGASILLRHGLLGVAVGKSVTTLSTSQGEVRCRWVVNAAGLGSDTIDRLFGNDRFTVVPRRGELLVFDKFARQLVDTIVLPVPTSKGKGVLVSPTIYGNVMLGPTSEDRADRGDTSTSEEGFAFLLEKGSRLMPALLDEEVTASYAGLRAATEHSDYVVDLDSAQRYLVLGGIRSTGLTASMALAEHAAQLLQDAGVVMPARIELPEAPRMPSIGEQMTRPFASDQAIDQDSDYGRVVCFCERVTRGEIRDALAGPLPPCDLDGLRRRTRATMGRCQGFYCGAEVDALLSGAAQ
ncbi:MAG: NAD(P)/FAD-dependent oxidoreductase [Actinomycetia bacterium]|nr:NAD(P)/FAD-dependent oxidoreductase [Actinomycetes bacterium]